MSPELAEALRTEIRNALDADGKPFDVNVARRVYDLAIAARDMCIAASNTVKEAIDQIKETNGPMETLDSPDTPESQMQVSETYGARLMRELLAMLPASRKTHEDPHVIIAAIADARERGMHDLAAKLEQRLVGTPLEQPKITHAEVVDNSYEHGFIHGSMQDNFDNGTINGVVGIDRQHWSPAYKEGFEAGRARRLSSGTALVIGSFDHGFADGRVGASPSFKSLEYELGYKNGLGTYYLNGAPPKSQGDSPQNELDPGAAPGGWPAYYAKYGFTGWVPEHPASEASDEPRDAGEAALMGLPWPSASGDQALSNPLLSDPPLCEACKKDPDPRGASACYDCREIARTRTVAQVGL